MPAKATHGEYAVEQAAKAKAAADAKAKAAALKAEKAEGEKVLRPLTAEAVKAAAGYVRADEQLEEAHHILGRCILAIEKVLVQYPALDLSIAKYCEQNLPKVSGPVFGSSPAYRALCAARVIEQDPSSASLSIDAVRAAHRVRDVKGAVPKVLKAAKAKAKANGTAVTASLVSEVLQDMYPKSEANTPGPAKGSAKAANGAKAKAAKNPRNTPVEPIEQPDLAVNGTRLKGAAQRLDTLFANVPTDSKATAYTLALTVLRSCEDYGTAATRAALTKHEPKATPKAKAAKATPKAKATTRTTRTTRTK